MTHSIREARKIYLAELRKWKEAQDKLGGRFGGDNLGRTASQGFAELIIPLRLGIDAMERVLKVNASDRKKLYSQVGLSTSK